MSRTPPHWVSFGGGVGSASTSQMTLRRAISVRLPALWISLVVGTPKTLWITCCHSATPVSSSYTHWTWSRFSLVSFTWACALFKQIRSQVSSRGLASDGLHITFNSLSSMKPESGPNGAQLALHETRVTDPTKNLEVATSQTRASSDGLASSSSQLKLQTDPLQSALVLSLISTTSSGSPQTVSAQLTVAPWLATSKSPVLALHPISDSPFKPLMTLPSSAQVKVIAPKPILSSRSLISTVTDSSILTTSPVSVPHIVSKQLENSADSWSLGRWYS